MEFRKLMANETLVRIAQCNQYGVTLLIYKDSRCDMRILDETVGPLNWQRSHTRDNQNCIVSIWDDEKKQWISKEDTGTESNTEAEKGLASDSFKRACFNWGIGRELYTAGRITVKADKLLTHKQEGNRWVCYDKFRVYEIGYDENGNINNLVIVNEKNTDVFKLGYKTKDQTPVVKKAYKNTIDDLAKELKINPNDWLNGKTVDDLTPEEAAQFIKALEKKRDEGKK